MNFYSFKKITIEKLSVLQSKYSFVLSFEDNVIKYNNENFSLNFSIDNFFEISIYIISNTQKDKPIYLTSLLKYLNFGNETISKVCKNQHNNKKTFEKYLDDLAPVINIVVDMLLKDTNILKNCLSYATLQQKLLYREDFANQIKKSLDETWNNHNYVGFLELYNNHKSLFPNNTVLYRKSIYSKKQVNRNTITRRWLSD